MARWRVLSQPMLKGFGSGALGLEAPADTQASPLVSIRVFTQAFTQAFTVPAFLHTASVTEALIQALTLGFIRGSTLAALFRWVCR